MLGSSDEARAQEPIRALPYGRSNSLYVSIITRLICQEPPG
jgi:hypothetical protein